MSNDAPGEENIKMIPPSNTDSVGNTDMDGSEKIVELINSSEVKVMKEGVKDFIDVDIENLDEGKVYSIEYQDDIYGVEKLTDGRIIFYEVVD